MVNQTTVTLDDLHRVLVPHLVKESFEWNLNTPLALTPNFDDGIILVAESTEPTPMYPCVMDEHSRISIPPSMATKLGMAPGCKIAMAPSNYAPALVLVQAAKA